MLPSPLGEMRRDVSGIKKVGPGQGQAQAQVELGLLREQGRGRGQLLQARGEILPGGQAVVLQEKGAQLVTVAPVGRRQENGLLQQGRNFQGALLVHGLRVNCGQGSGESGPIPGIPGVKGPGFGIVFGPEGPGDADGVDPQGGGPFRLPEKPGLPHIDRLHQDQPGAQPGGYAG